MKSQADGRGPRNKFTLKRSMAYGILHFAHARIQEASISLTILSVFCLLKIEETCFSAFAIDMSPQQEHLGIKQAPTPPTSGFVI